MTAILDVRNLSTCFNTSAGALAAVNDVSFVVRPGEILGLVGRIRFRQKRDPAFVDTLVAFDGFTGRRGDLARA